MAYDTHHKKLGIKAIGTVESNLTYDAINYSDPITVGVAQWYGTRAAQILNRMRNENPSSWVGVAGSLTSSLIANSETSSWWTTRYLTQTEGQSLRPVLIANKDIQNNQFGLDLDGYMDTATRMGMDIENNTLAALFFASMWHQSPREAQRVLSTMGPSSNLDRLHSGALNNSVLGRYRTRQNTVRAILLSGDTSGVDDPGSVGDDPTPGGDPGGGATRALSDVAHIQTWANGIVVHKRDGTKHYGYHSGPNMYSMKVDPNIGADVPNLPDNPNPDVPPGSPIALKREAIRDFLAARVDNYAYSQGPGRLNPPSSGYTDCSALLHWAFKTVLGITIGTWTGNQHTNGQTIMSGSGPINTSSLAIGDLIFIDWGSYTAAFDHVEMYYGGNQVIGHGGPDPGPDIQNISMVNSAGRWKVQRVIL